MIVPEPSGKPKHGQICLTIGRLLGDQADRHDLGHVLSTDSGVINVRGPDRVRGADIAYVYNAERTPRLMAGDAPFVLPELFREEFGVGLDRLFD